jgi:cell division protein FtsZ
MAEIKPDIETFAKIKVVGVGGSGGSALNRMIASKIRGVEFVAINTDVQALHYSQASTKLHIGKTATRGLGAGMDPEVGRRAAEESQDEIQEALKGADMVFVTCGLGGGTGSGAGPKVAEIAKEMGALTVAVVTRPFMFEGAQRRAIADAAYDRLVDVVDTIITIPNDRVLQIIDRKTSLLDAFEIVDDVLRQGVQGISEIITVPGLINVDFADVRSIMANRGSALMGIGRGTGENRAAEAAKNAVASPLLEVSVDGAKGILFTITGGSNLGMYEVSEAAKVITQSADPNAKVIFGAIIDEGMKDEIKVTVIATGFEQRPAPAKVKSVVAGGTYTSSRTPEPLDRMSFTGRPTQASTAPAPRSSDGPFTAAAALPVDEPVVSAPPRMPDPAPAAHQPHVQSPTYAPTQPPRPPAPPSRVPGKTSEEEDLEIPAFLRKKMM